MLMINSLLVVKVQDKLELLRVLWIDIDDDTVYLINIRDNNLPIKYSYLSLEQQIYDNEIYIEDNDPFFRIIDEEKLSEKDKELRERAWIYIKDIVVEEPYIYEAKYRRQIINTLIKDKNIHINSMIKYLKRYWKRGMCKNTLLPDYYLCGAKGKERNYTNLKRGRPIKYGNNLGINVDEEMKKIFNIALNKYYYNAAKKSLTVTYQCMIKDYFTSNEYYENGNRYSMLDENKMPSLGQFKHYFYNHRNIKKEITSRISSKEYLQIGRGVIGNSTVMANGPGDIFQIDATIADVYLCSSIDRNRIIGRPIIYYFIDVYSRMITGIYVGLEGPSWIGASMAIINAASNKKEFCSEYGIDIADEEWKVGTIPNIILADRGEFAGDCSESLINDFGIIIQNTPPFRADFKGVVEQHFNILNNQRIKPFLPGSIDINKRERGDKDYRLDAKLNLKEFTKVIIRCVLYHNNNNYINDYPRDESMLKDNVKPIPAEIWKWGIKNKSGRLRKVNLDLLKISLMPKAAATVTAKGILFKKIYYTSNELLKNREFEKARNNGRWKVDIVYDPRNLNHIYLKNYDNKPFIKLTLIDYQTKYINKCIEEIEYINALERLDKEEYKKKELQKKINLMEEIDAIVQEAKNSFKEEYDKKQSNTGRLKGIKLNRKIEKSINRNEEAFELDINPVNKDTKIIYINNEDSDEDEISKLELLRKRQKEKLDSGNR